MESIKLDKNYLFLEEKGDYEDDFIDTAEAIGKAKADKKISDTEASLLLNILLKREFKKEATTLLSLKHGIERQ